MQFEGDCIYDIESLMNSCFSAETSDLLQYMDLAFGKIWTEELKTLKQFLLLKVLLKIR